MALIATGMADSHGPVEDLELEGDWLTLVRRRGHQSSARNKTSEKGTVNMTDSTPQPEVFEQLSDGVYRATAMIAGVQLDVFTPLKDGPMSAEHIADAIGVDAFKLRPLLYALVIIDLLIVEGDLFSNTAEADHFLVQGRPAYMKTRLEFNLSLWQKTLNTAESIRTGKPQAKVDYVAMPPDELESFLRGLHWNTLRVGRALADKIDFSSCRSLLDVGGGSGGLAIAMTEAYPDLEATVVDLPAVTPITQRIVEEDGAAKRVQVMTADVVREELTGSFDAAALKSFINVISPEQARQALHNINRVINPGGKIYITGGSILDNSRLSPPDLVTFNLVMLNCYEGGQSYTEQEHRDWLAEAGFEDIQRVPDVGVVALKPLS